MIWVIRAGHDSCYFNKFMRTNKVYLTWDGYRFDLSGSESLNAFRKIVENEKKIDNHTTISNWAGQLYSFVQRMQIGDYVLIPCKDKKSFCFSKIVGEYMYDEEDEDGLYHSRKIDVLIKELPKSEFPQNVLYSLGAYRTVFIANHEEEILKIIKRWKDRQE